MLRRIILAIVVGIVVTLVLYLIGALLVTMSVAWVVTIGAWMQHWGAVLGLLAALWYGFGGGNVLR